MTKSPNMAPPLLSVEELQRIHAYWRATLYLCVGMIFLKDNPLLTQPLKIDHIKKRLLGHWGTLHRHNLLNLSIRSSSVSCFLSPLTTRYSTYLPFTLRSIFPCSASSRHLREPDEPIQPHEVSIFSKLYAGTHSPFLDSR